MRTGNAPNTAGKVNTAESCSLFTESYTMIEESEMVPTAHLCTESTLYCVKNFDQVIGSLPVSAYVGHFQPAGYHFQLSQPKVPLLALQIPLSAHGTSSSPTHTTISPLPKALGWLEAARAESSLHCQRTFVKSSGSFRNLSKGCD